MASGPIAYWAYGVGGLFVLLNARNLYLGCSNTVAAWAGFEYTCDAIEEQSMFISSMLSVAAFSMLIMAATVVDSNALMAKIIAIALIFDPVGFVAYWSITKLNGNSVPSSVWLVVGCTVNGFFVLQVLNGFCMAVCPTLYTFATAAVTGLEGEDLARPKKFTFGALNKWAFGIGFFLSLVTAANLFTSCDEAIENWGFGKYTCKSLTTLVSLMTGMKTLQVVAILSMAATATANKTDLLKIYAPFILGQLALLFHNSQLKINGRSCPASFYVFQSIILGSFFIAFIMHNNASARQVESTGCEPLVAA